MRLCHYCPFPQPVQTSIINHITLPYLLVLPHLGVERKLAQGVRLSPWMPLHLWEVSRQGYKGESSKAWEMEEEKAEREEHGGWVYRFRPGVGGRERPAP